MHFSWHATSLDFNERKFKMQIGWLQKRNYLIEFIALDYDSNERFVLNLFQPTHFSDTSI